MTGWQLPPPCWRYTRPQRCRVHAYACLQSVVCRIVYQIEIHRLRITLAKLLSDFCIWTHSSFTLSIPPTWLCWFIPSSVMSLLHLVYCRLQPKAVWQWQRKIVKKKLCNNIVSCEFLWIRRTCDYIRLNAHYCVLFSSRIRFNVWSVSGYAHVFVLLSVVIVTLPQPSSCRPRGQCYCACAHVRGGNDSLCIEILTEWIRAVARH